jgi:hypothetical protein
MLSVMHSLPKDSHDLLWVDFTGVDCDVDGIARVSTQLFLK